MMWPMLMSATAVVAIVAVVAVAVAAVVPVLLLLLLSLPQWFPLTLLVHHSWPIRSLFLLLTDVCWFESNEPSAEGTVSVWKQEKESAGKVCMRMGKKRHDINNIHANFQLAYG